jgi:hypothetical protein
MRTLRVFILLAVLSACEEELLPQISAWLHCDECIDGERAAVRALGERAVPQLARALLEGPPADRRDVIRQQAISAHSKAGVANLSASQYSAQLVDNFVARYQERAAVSLADIATPQARSALDQALQPPRSAQYRADVLRKIRLARATINATPFGGRFERQLVDFGDTAFLLAPPGGPFATGDIVAVDDSVFPAADLILSDQPMRRGIAAVGAAGSHLISVKRFGSSITEVVGLTITSIADANDRAMQQCADRACEVSRAPIIPAAALPYKAFLSLWSKPPHRDSLDMFRFMPSSSLPVTAELDWRGGGNLDLSWQRCSTPTSVGNLNGATAATRPERTSVVIPGGECWLLLVALNSRLPGPTAARLHLKSP